MSELPQRVYAGKTFDVSRLWGDIVTTAIFDADSHLMETADWLGSFADPQVRDQLLPLVLDGAGAKAVELTSKLPTLWEEQRHQSIGPDVLWGGWRGERECVGGEECVGGWEGRGGEMEVVGG